MKIFLLSLIIYALSGCSHYKPVGSNIASNNGLKEKVEMKSDSVKVKKLSDYEINLDEELIYSDEIVHLNELNKISNESGTKTSRDQLLDSLFANPNRKAKDVKVSYLQIVRNKKRTLRRKISSKRKDFVKDQKQQREEFKRKADLKRSGFDHKSVSDEEKKLFYKELDAERKLFLSEAKGAKKIFNSNLKDLQKEIDARFKDLDKDFNDRLRVLKAKQKK